MNLLEKNLAAIGRRDPGMAERLRRLAPSARIRKATGAGGEVTLAVKGTDGEGTLRLPDIGGPTLDSRGEELGAALMVALLGLGSGRLFSEIAGRTAGHAFVLLIEPDADLFAAVLGEVDLSSVLGLERVSLSVGEKPHYATLVRAERAFTVFSLRDFTVIENPWSAPLYATYFSAVKAALGQLKNLGAQNVITLAALGREWKRNIFENLPALLGSPPVSTLFEKYAGFPAVVVAAGPSLSKNIRTLASAKGRLLIIAVDTAVRPLLRNGVTPDIVVAVDSQEENYMHLEGLRLPDTLFVLNPVVHPGIVKEHAGPMAFMSYPEPLLEWIEETAGVRGTVRSGGSVATTAFDLAVKLGCSPVIFAGQDMSIINGQSHASGTIQSVHTLDMKTLFEADGRRNGPDERELIEREDMFGRPVVSLRKMESWKRWFEMIIAEESVFALNATEGGVPIDGAAAVSIEEAIARYVDMSRAIPAAREIIGDVQGPDNLIEVEAALVRARDEARTIKSVCGRAMQAVNAATEKSEPSRAGRAVEDEMRLLNGLSRGILDRKLFTGVNRFGIEQILDAVEKARHSGSGGDKPPGVIGGYRILFTQMYELASEFEKGAGAAVASIKKMAGARERE